MIKARERSERGKAIRKAANQKRRLNHRDALNATKRNYYARKKQAAGTHTAQDIQAQYAKQQGKCYYCKCEVGWGKHEFHVDHVIPLSRGGSNGPENLVIACPTCNGRKYNKLLHEWIREEKSS